MLGSRVADGNSHLLLHFIFHWCNNPSLPSTIATMTVKQCLLSNPINSKYIQDDYVDHNHFPSYNIEIHILLAYIEVSLNVSVIGDIVVSTVT